MTTTFFQTTLFFFCALLSVTGCPTQLEVEDINKNNLLPIGPNTPKQDIKDAGVPEERIDAGHGSSNHETILEPHNTDAGSSESPQTSIHNDSGSMAETIITSNMDAGGSTTSSTTMAEDAGNSQPGLNDGGTSTTHPNPWSEPDYTDGPSTPGSYAYARLAIGGLGVTEAVAIHPDASYALIVQRTDIVHILDFSTMATIRLDVGNYTFNDVRFHPDGQSALLVGYQNNGGTTEGVLIRFNDQSWRSGQHTVSDLFNEINDVPASLKIQSLRFQTDPSEPAVLLFTGGSSSNRLAYLRTYDIENDSFDYLGTTSTGSTEVTDLALVKNELGGTGYLIVGGHTGATFHYFTVIGGVGEWRAQPGNSSTGNLSYVESHPSRNYALPINWSSGKIYRFEGASMCNSETALSYNINNVRSIAFQPNGQRALIFGRTSSDQGSVYEYRHDQFSCSFQSCDVTYVPIHSFTSSPYNATGNTYITDGAWRSDCVGGLLVANDPGMVITFQAEGASDCWN